MTDTARTSRDIISKLTAPGGPYPLVQRTVDGRQVTVFDSPTTTLQHVVESMNADGERTAVVYASERWTYSRLVAEANEVGAGLRKRFSVEPGDRVAIAMRNYPEWPVIFWACQIIGATVVPINAWSTAGELEYLLGASTPVVVFADAERHALLPADRVHSVRGTVGVRCMEPAGDVAYAKLRIPGAREIPAHVHENDPATVMFTSGTTGVPKAVVATHLNHVTTLHSMGLRSAAARVGAGGQARADAPAPPLLLGFPLFHIAGITAMTAAHAAGRCVVLMRKWDIDDATELIAREGIGEIGGPPLIGRAVLDAAQKDPAPFTTLTSIGFGGALVPTGYIDDVHTIFEGRVAAKTGYGMTETTSAVVSIAGKDFLDHPTSVGRPLPTAEVRVVDESGDDVAAGTRGELLVRGSQLVSRYEGRPDENAKSFRDGWFWTGDLVTVDADGFIDIIGRAKDVIIRGGENVYCAEVESVLSGHPEVLEAAVIGVPDERLGEQVCAVVHPRDGRSPSPDAIREYCSLRLSAFKVPVYVVHCADPLPRNAAGKLLKTELLRKLPTPVKSSSEKQWI